MKNASNSKHTERKPNFGFVWRTQNTNPKRQTNKTVGRTWTRAGLKFYVPGATLFLPVDPSYSTPIPQHFHRKMYFATGKHIFFVRLQVSYSPLLRTYSANTCMKMCIVLWRNAIFSTGRGVDVCKKLEFQLETCIERRKHPVLNIFYCCLTGCHPPHPKNPFQSSLCGARSLWG